MAPIHRIRRTNRLRSAVVIRVAFHHWANRHNGPSSRRVEHKGRQLVLLHFCVGIVVLKNLLEGRSMARHVRPTALAQSDAMAHAHTLKHH